MFERKVITKYKKKPEPYTITIDIKPLIQQYIDQGRLLKRETSKTSHDVTVDVWTWRSKEDFIEFYNEETYRDFVDEYGQYVDQNNIEVTYETNEF